VLIYRLTFANCELANISDLATFSIIHLPKLESHFMWFSVKPPFGQITHRNRPVQGRQIKLFGLDTTINALKLFLFDPLEYKFFIFFTDL
jgi:hypothetical protein